MSETKARRLTAKQFAFCKHYTSKDCYGNATESASRAGYKGNRKTLEAVGRENLGKPRIKQEVDRMIEEASTGANITIERVLVNLQKNHDRAIEGKNYAAANKALELQGKYLKMWVERIEHIQNLDEITDDMLGALINELTERLGVNIRFTDAGTPAENGPVPGAAGTPTTH